MPDRQFMENLDKELHRCGSVWNMAAWAAAGGALLLLMIYFFLINYLIRWPTVVCLILIVGFLLGLISQQRGSASEIGSNEVGVVPDPSPLRTIFMFLFFPSFLTLHAGRSWRKFFALKCVDREKLAETLEKLASVRSLDTEEFLQFYPDDWKKRLADLKLVDGFMELEGPPRRMAVNEELRDKLLLGSEY